MNFFEAIPSADEGVWSGLPLSPPLAYHAAISSSVGTGLEASCSFFAAISSAVGGSRASFPFTIIFT